MARATRDQPRDETRARAFAERLAAMFADAGTPRMPARVLTALMCSDEGALTVAELTEQLKVSPAAVSGAVSYLSQVGLVHREHVPGSRRDRYRISDTPWHETFAARNRFLRAFADVSAEGVRAVGGATTPAGQRLAEIRHFFEFLEDEMDGVLARWEKAKRRRAK